MKRAKTPPAPTILQVWIYEAKPNKMFTAEITAVMRFLRYSAPVVCAECGKKGKKMWTMLVEFKAHSMGSFVLQSSNKVHPPLTAVCDEHPLRPHWPEDDQPAKDQPSK